MPEEKQRLIIVIMLWVMLCRALEHILKNNGKNVMQALVGAELTWLRGF